jgi:hypothetical protein
MTESLKLNDMGRTSTGHMSLGQCLKYNIALVFSSVVIVIYEYCDEYRTSNYIKETTPTSASASCRTCKVISENPVFIYNATGLLRQAFNMLCPYKQCSSSWLLM